jgi:hypothetical protein
MKEEMRVAKIAWTWRQAVIGSKNDGVEEVHERLI